MGIAFRADLACGTAMLLFAAVCTRQDLAGEHAAVITGRDGEAQSTRTLCDSAVMCFTDTARVVALAHEPGRDVRALWLVFASAGDSIELRVTPSVPDLQATITVSRGRTPGVQERDSSGNTAPYVRFRLTEAAAIAAHISMDDGLRDTVEYTLAVRQIAAPSTQRSLLIAGAAAGLTLSSGRETDEFTITPLSLAGAQRDTRNWTVFPRRYKVALAADSQYVICRIPCSHPDTITLRADEHLTRTY